MRCTRYSAYSPAASAATEAIAMPTGPVTALDNSALVDVIVVLICAPVFISLPSTATPLLMPAIHSAVDSMFFICAVSRLCTHRVNSPSLSAAICIYGAIDLPSSMPAFLRLLSDIEKRCAAELVR